MKKLLVGLITLLVILGVTGIAGAVIWDTKLLMTGGQMVPYGAPWFSNSSKMYFNTPHSVYMFYNATSNTLNVTGATTVFPGAVTIGGTAVSGGTIAYDVTVTANHNFAQAGTGTFSTGSGAISLNGDTTLASGKNFAMTGAGTTSTGTGAVAINGNTAITGTKTLLVNGGAAKFGAAVTLASLIDNATASIGGAVTAMSTLRVGSTATVNALVSNGTISGTGLIGTSISNSGNMQNVGTAKFNGATTTNGLTVNTSATLAVTDADKLTVGGIIVPQYVTVTFPLSSASTNGTVFVPPLNNYQLMGAALALNVASGGSGAGTVKLMKCTAGQDPATAGVEMLTAGMSIKGSANTVVTGTPVATLGRAQVNTTEFVGIRFNTQLTSMAGGAITMSFKRIA